MMQKAQHRRKSRRRTRVRELHDSGLVLDICDLVGQDTQLKKIRDFLLGAWIARLKFSFTIIARRIEGGSCIITNVSQQQQWFRSCSSNFQRASPTCCSLSTRRDSSPTSTGSCYCAPPEVTT
ncbi:hypothetical protein R1flu_022870 [Riccia fluitans]|uniref:Uncharacterized protein n=1 Tax=Riccia fluitans TaxID=41844 RepID=A0ABD1XR42_9MARC